MMIGHTGTTVGTILITTTMMDMVSPYSNVCNSFKVINCTNCHYTSITVQIHTGIMIIQSTGTSTMMTGMTGMTGTTGTATITILHMIQTMMETLTGGDGMYDID